MIIAFVQLRTDDGWGILTRIMTWHIKPTYLQHNGIGNSHFENIKRPVKSRGEEMIYYD